MPDTNYGYGIYIAHDSRDVNFESQARISLHILRSRPLGLRLLQAIGAAGADGAKTVVIENIPGPANLFSSTAIATLDTGTAFRAQLLQPGNRSITDPAFARVVDGQAGSSAIVRWCPLNVIPSAGINRPAYIALAHELIHALHYLRAECRRIPLNQLDLTIDGGVAEEEARTVGLGPYDWPNHSEEFCENGIRHAFDQPKRDYYTGNNTLAHVTRTAAPAN